MFFIGLLQLTAHFFFRGLLMRLLSIILLLGLYPLHAQLIINEFHPTPSSGEPEWIELYNTSKDIFYADSLLLYDQQTTIVLPCFIAHPFSFIILTKDSHALKESRYVDPFATIVQAKIPTLNNSRDCIKISYKDSIKIDSVYYTLNNHKKGISLERYISETKVFLNSIALDSATCGFINSISPLDNDIMIKEYIQVGDSLHVILLNNSYHLISDVSLSFSIENESTIKSVKEIQQQELCTVTILLNDIPHYTLGWNTITVSIINNYNDPRNYNDSLVFTSFQRDSSLLISFNEILYEPDTSNQINEFIELYVQSEKPFSLDKYSISDNTHTYLFLDENMYDTSIHYVVITKDTINMDLDALSKHIPVSIQLQNSGSELLLKDPKQSILDKFSYSASMHNPRISQKKGKSLEKGNPFISSAHSNTWTTSGSILGATPGKVNSTYYSNDAIIDNYSINPQPYYPSKGDLCFINFHSTVPTFITIQVYTKSKSYCTTIVNSLYVSGNITIPWNGQTEYGILEPGAYILLLQMNHVDTSYSENKMIPIIIGL